MAPFPMRTSNRRLKCRNTHGLPTGGGRSGLGGEYILLLFVAFCLAILVAADLVAPVYNAKAVLEILPERQPNAPANPMTSAAADEVRLNTEAQKVGAEPVVRTVFNAWQAGRVWSRSRLQRSYKRRDGQNRRIGRGAD